MITWVCQSSLIDASPCWFRSHGQTMDKFIGCLSQFRKGNSIGSIAFQRLCLHGVPLHYLMLGALHWISVKVLTISNSLANCIGSVNKFTGHLSWFRKANFTGHNFWKSVFSWCASARFNSRFFSCYLPVNTRTISNLLIWMSPVSCWHL